MRRANRTSTTMPAGKYYIGDPCYIFSNDKDTWDELLNHTNYFSGSGEYSFKGYTFVGGSTNYGDGTYLDNFGREYAVDAGLIAIMPIAMLEIDGEETEESISKHDHMHIVEFKKPFTATYDSEGIYEFGDVMIDTTDEDIEEDEDEWEIEDDELDDDL